VFYLYAFGLAGKQNAFKYVSMFVFAHVHLCVLRCRCVPMCMFIDAPLLRMYVCVILKFCTL